MQFNLDSFGRSRTYPFSRVIRFRFPTLLRVNLSVIKLSNSLILLRRFNFLRNSNFYKSLSLNRIQTKCNRLPFHSLSGVFVLNLLCFGFKSFQSDSVGLFVLHQAILRVFPGNEFIFLSFDLRTIDLHCPGVTRSRLVYESCISCTQRASICATISFRLYFSAQLIHNCGSTER